MLAPWLCVALAADPLLFGEARAPLAVEADASAEACGNCHDEALANWRRSMHAHAATNPWYTISHQHEPMRWCDDCHAPSRLGEQGRSEGVTCASCHVRAGVVLSSHTSSEAGAHRVRFEEALAGDAICTECHQFNFPVGRADPVRYGRWPMQNTATESAGTARCVSCHDPHDPRGAHDLVKVRGALRLEARFEDHGVRVSLMTIGVAHRVPTGDPNRRLTLDLCADEPCLRPLDTVELQRQIHPDGESWKIVREASLGPEGAVLFFPEAGGARFVRLNYRYAAKSNEPDLEPDQVEAWLMTKSIGRAAASPQGASR